MTKDELIKDLKDSKQNTLDVFKKGYLKNLSLDNELEDLVFKKLCNEANFLGRELDKLVNNHPFSEEELVELSNLIDKLEKVVFNVFLSQLQRNTYISSSFLTLQKKLNKKFLLQYKNKLEEGYEVIEDENGNQKIIGLIGQQLVYQSLKTPLKQILKDWGLDTSHEAFNLLLFGLIPREDLDSYRKLYLFEKFFKFV